MIRANGTTNLFLLNPNGIIFGPNAQLNIGGSFLGSTASSLNFADGTQFSATKTQTKPLLTVSVPLGLQFGANPGRILVQGDGQGLRATSDLIDTTVGLRVQPNQTLALVGGDVALTGGTLKTAGGRIELGSVAGPGLVDLTPTDFGLALGYSGVPNFGDIQLSGAAAVDASGEGGGDIQVRGRRVTLTDGSAIETNTLGSESGGTLSVTAKESVELIGRSENGRFPSGLFAQTSGAGAGGDLSIATAQFVVRDEAQVAVSSKGSGNAGNLEVAARSIRLDNQAAFRAESASGRGGNVLLQVEDLLLMRRNSQISITAGPSANSGNLAIDTELLIASENSDFILNLEGRGGNFFVRTQVFFLSPDSDIIVNSGEEFQWQNPDPLGRVLVSLPEVVDATGLIATGCAAVGENEFIITGRGGLPPNPTDFLNSDAVWIDLDSTTQQAENRPSSEEVTQPTNSTQEQLVEATGWVTNNKGEVVLTASAPNATPHIPWMPSATCHGAKTSS